jgi:putative MATE family efflux protein
MNQPIFTKVQLRNLIIPLIIEQLLAVSVGMLDTVMVATVSEKIMSGVSLVDTIAILIIGLFSAFGTGGAILAGQYIGAKEHKKANEAAVQLIGAVLIISLVVTLFTLVLNYQMLHLFFGGVEPEVMAAATTYLNITAYSFPFIAVFNAGAALFRVMGNGSVPMINAIIINIVNLVGNAVFIYVFHLGAFGAGLSTLISRAIGAIVIMWMLRKPALILCIRSYNFLKIKAEMVKKIVSIGLPNGLENSIFQAGKILLMGLVTSFGTTAIAANSMANSLSNIEILPGMAVGLALTTVVSQCAGAKEYEQAKDYIKKLMKFTYISLLFLNIGFYIATVPMIGLFSLTPETSKIAIDLILFHGVMAVIVWPTAFVLPNAFRATGDVKYTMVISIVSMFTFRIGFSYLFASTTNWGVLGIWYAMVIDWVFRSLCFGVHYIRNKWERPSLVADTPVPVTG